MLWCSLTPLITSHNGRWGTAINKNLQIKKSNALVEAGYRLTLVEHRLILACIAKSKGQTLNDQTLYEVDALSVVDLVGGLATIRPDTKSPLN